MPCPVMLINEFFNSVLEYLQGGTLDPYLPLVPLGYALKINTKILNKLVLHYRNLEANNILQTSYENLTLWMVSFYFQALLAKQKYHNIVLKLKQNKLSDIQM